MVQPVLFACWAMGEWDMIIRDIIEEVDLVLIQQQACSNGVNWRIAPALVEEATSVVEGVEIVNVSWGAQPIQVTNFKIGPLSKLVRFKKKPPRATQILEGTYEMAVVVCVSVIITKELHVVVLSNVLRMRAGEVLHSIPERGDGLDIFVQTKREAILLLVFCHVLEGVVVDVTIELNAGLYAPVPLVI